MKHARLLDIAPREHEHLHAALFTSFDPPDTTLLTDRLLPSLLNLPPMPEDAGGFARAQAMLHQALAPLRGRLVVVSSSRGEWTPHWLSHFVRFRRTGAGARIVVQHAKLWMLHWKHNNGRERLELIVSSANLTGGGIDDQIQGTWRASVQLGPRAAAQRKSWGPLPAFLEQLGSACDQPDDLRQFSALLDMASCPKDVRFVATAPAKGIWGQTSLAAALDGMKPDRVRILTPFTGSWQPASLQSWLADSGCPDAQVELVAVGIGQRLPESAQWILAERTRDDLAKSVTFGLLTTEAACALRGGVGPDADRRWTHAKLYEFRKGRKCALLVTSANFTPAAWNSGGDGNFELGVLLLGQSLPIAFLPAEAEEVMARGQAMMNGSGLWADAEWDGHEVVVRVRAKEAGTLQLAPTRRGESPAAFGAARNGPTTVRIKRSVPAPRSITIIAGVARSTVPVTDIREEPDDLPVGGLEEKDAQDWKDRLLLEKYGAAVDEEGGNGARRKGKTGKAGIADYGLPLLEDARTWFGHIDNWAAACDKEETIDLRRDGKRLLQIYQRKGTLEGTEGNIARAVAEELIARLGKAGKA